MHTQQWTQQPQQQQQETAQMAALSAERDRQRDNLTGVWVASYKRAGGLQSAVLFKTEIDALRHAAGTSGPVNVEFVAYGSDVFA